MSLNEFLGDTSQQPRPPPLHANFKLTLLQPWVLGRMRWMHSRRLVRVLAALCLWTRSYQIITAAARDDDRGDRRGGRDDFLSNRRALSTSATCLMASNQMTSPSGQTGLSSEGRPTLAHPASLYSVCWKSGF